MTSGDTIRTNNEQDTLSRIASDLEIAGVTVGSLIKMAEKALAEEDPSVATLVQVAGRYAQDIAEITQRLLNLSSK